MSAESYYFQVLDLVLARGVSVSTRAQTYWPNAEYKRSERVIHLPRPSGGLWLHSESDPEEANLARAQLLRDSVEIRDETCLLAHELGHVHSSFENYEEIMQRYETDPASVRPAEKRAIYQEEIFAWDWARTLLHDALGYCEMVRFEEVARERLSTYAAFNVPDEEPRR